MPSTNRNRTLVIWSVSPLLERVLASPVAVHPRVRVLSSEADFLGGVTDRREVAAFLVGQYAATGASSAVRAFVASRGPGWPPVVLFGPDGEALHGLGLHPNSVVVVPMDDPPALAERLLRVVDYWVSVNEVNIGT